MIKLCGISLELARLSGVPAGAAQKMLSGIPKSSLHATISALNRVLAARNSENQGISIRDFQYDAAAFR